MVVAGDFNMSDRVVSYRAMDDALTDAMGRPRGTTRRGGGRRLRIDRRAPGRRSDTAA